MRSDGNRDRGREPFSNNTLIAAVVGLFLLTAAIVAWTTLKPYSNAQQASGKLDTAAPVPVIRAKPAKPVVRPKPRPVASTEPTKSAPAPAPEPAPAPAPVAKPKLTLPEKMAHLVPGSSQMIIAVAAKLGSSSGTVYVFNKKDGHWVQKLSTPTRMGTNGLIDGEARHQGSRTTPTGIWTIGKFVFGKAKKPPSGTLMPYRQITARSWWSSRNDSTYNTWVDSASYVPGEHLLNAASLQYEFVLDSAYNEKPNKRVIGRGTAIFLHVFDPPTYNNGFTAGCIGISRDSMIRVFRLIDPAKNPTFAVGTLVRGTPTSIYSY